MKKTVESMPMQKKLDILRLVFNQLIDVDYLKDIETAMELNGWSWEDVFRDKLKNPNKKLWRIVSCKNIA